MSHETRAVVRQARQEPHGQSEGTVTQYLNKKNRVDLVRVTRVIQESRSLRASTVKRYVRVQARKSSQWVEVQSRTVKNSLAWP